MTPAARGAALKLVPEEPDERMNKSMNSWETITLIAIKNPSYIIYLHPMPEGYTVFVSSFQTISTTKTRTKLLRDLLYMAPSYCQYSFHVPMDGQYDRISHS